MRFCLVACAVFFAVACAFAEDEVSRLCAETATWEFGHDRSAVSRLAAVAYSSKPATRPAIERSLLRILEDPKATYAGKQAVCRILKRIGTPQAVSVLAKLLDDPRLCTMALYALAAIPGDETGKALREHVGKAGPCRNAIIAALGARRDRNAVRVLAQIAADGHDPTGGVAAVGALGCIGTAEAAQALEGLKSTEALRAAKCNALLACAETQGKENAERARAIYAGLCRPENPVFVRAAALRGLAATGGNRVVATVLAFLTSNDPTLRRAGAAAVVSLPGAGATKALAGLLPGLAAETQVSLVHALGVRGDPVAAQPILGLAVNSTGVVQLAALEALGSIGGTAAADTLCRFAGQRGQVGAVAFDSLRRARGVKFDAVLLEKAGAGKPVTRVVCIRALAARGSTAAVSALFDLAGDPDPAVRRETFKALAVLAPPKRLPDVLKQIVDAAAESDRSIAAKTAAALIGKLDDRAAALPALSAALKSAKSAAVRATFVRLLGSVGGKVALAEVRGALSSPDTQVRDAAIRTLAAWNGPEAVGPLLQVVRDAGSDVHRILALRGCARLLGMPSERSEGATVDLFRQALALAKRGQEKKQLLAALGSTRSPETLALAADLLTENDVKAEASAACRNILGRMDKAGLLAASATVEKLAGAGKNEALAVAARAALVRARSKEYEAENAKLTGAVVERVHAGASGKAYVNFIKRKDGVIQWRVAAPATSRFALMFRFALGSGVRPLRIEVDDRPIQKRLDFKGSGGWSKWKLRRVGVVSLGKGLHTVRAVTLGADGPNIDFLQILPEP